MDEGESKTNCFSQGLSNQVYWQIAVWSRSDPYFRKLVLHFTGIVYDDQLVIILVVFASLVIFTCVTFDATAQLIHALITSRLDFCISILYDIPNKQIERLQQIQNQAARMLKRIPRRNHITPVLRELHWLRIHD